MSALLFGVFYQRISVDRLGEDLDEHGRVGELPASERFKSSDIDVDSVQ